MIYWDHNASAPLRAEVAELLRSSFAADSYGNASSVHQHGRKARLRMETARQSVARMLGAEVKEITFTGSGTEGDALCIKGAFTARKDLARTRIVTTATEHPAVLSACVQLERTGAVVTRVAPSANGTVSLDRMLAELTSDVALCSVMWANNETGVLQPVREIARACRERGILFHTDAVQAAGKIPVNLREVDADLLTLSAHKFGGPPGVGACVIRRGVNVEGLAPGHQENGRRGGTQNVPYIEAFARAFELADRDVDAYSANVAKVRDGFEALLRSRISGVSVNGEDAPRVANTSNVLFEGADGEALLIALDLAGISVSTGAACASGSLTPSHVLIAMGRTSAQAHGSLRFSLGREATMQDAERVVDVLARSIDLARTG